MSVLNFNEQPAFQELRKRLSLDAGRIVGFVGAGLSQPAKLPNWPELRERLIKEYRLEAATFDSEKAKKIIQGCNSAEQVSNLWLSFSILKKLRSDNAFESSVRRHLGCSSLDPPENYSRFWKTGLDGIVSLNLDDFSQRSFSIASPGAPLELFTGTRIQDFTDVFSRESRFLCNLHGQLGESSSWVFTEEDRTRLHFKPGFTEFFSACFLTTTVIFVGIGADDVAAGGLLFKLLKDTKSTRAGNHYWITDRRDAGACKFADETGVRRICYQAANGHEELNDIFAVLADKKLKLPTPSVVTPHGKRVRNFEKPSVRELQSLEDVNEVRKKLNEIALDILDNAGSERIAKYEEFLEEYEEVIARSWFIPKSAKASFFDYKLERLICGDGAFGKVYEAKNDEGKSFAVKIIHNSVHDDPEMLEAFRRGVASMKIVSKRKVDGVVSIVDAWEMPASIVMEFVDGLNLEQAVVDHAIMDWGGRLRVFEQLAQVLLRAHRLPEVVVHRDVRPPNVILRDLHCSDDDINVSLVDFDLSWHRDAFGKSIQQTSGVHGYFAPEQYRNISGASSRSALVDSFGMGMTVFFVVTGRHPQFSEASQDGWEHEVNQSFRLKKCDPWRCIPTRLARLVVRCTKPIQSDRPDMTAALREFQVLMELYDQDKISDIRLVIDEIGHLSKRLGGNYLWDETEGKIIYDSPSGLSLSIMRVERFEIAVIAEWGNSGDSKYQTVKRYFDGASSKLSASLRSSGWHFEIDAKFDGVRMLATRKLELSKIKAEDIQCFADDVDEIMTNLNYSGQ